MNLREILCKPCNRKVNISNVRYGADGKTLVCNECYSKGAENLPQSQQRKAVSDRERFMCLKCKYKFSRSRNSRLARACPYCAGVNLTEDKGSAEDLLKQASGDEFVRL